LTPSPTLQYVCRTLVILRSRSISLCLAVLLTAGSSTAFAQAPPPPPASPAGSTAAATAAIAAGDKATRAKDYATALTQYQTAQQTVASSRAEMGVADAFYNLGRLGEAYDTYTDVQTTYAGKLGAVEKGLVGKRLKELATKTGYLSIRVNQDGAEVDVDTKLFGTTPVPALVRVATGTHAVHIVKTGFVPFDGNAEVAADGKAIVDATLAPVATQGHVVVHSNGTEPLRVLVDGVDVGATPWEGDLPPGSHTITGRSSSATAAGQTVDVAVGSRTAVDLIASDTAAHVSVTTSDGKGVIYLDGVVKGEGQFKGDVAPGPHSVVVSRDGYQRFEKTLTLAEQQTWAETVTLSQTPATKAGTGEAEHAYQGLYGGFGLDGMFGVGGMGTTLETNCGNLGAASCSTPNAIGGGAFGFIGYTWDPVGFEFMLGGMADQAKQTATYTATPSTSTSSILPAANPARVETFSFLRIGGIAAIRARVAFQTGFIRGSLSAGPGVSYRLMQMERDAAATDNSGRIDKYVPDPVSYISPAISADASVQFRLSPTVAIAVGLEFWADSASIAGNNSVGPSTGHALVNPSNSSATPVPIPTPGYNIASGSQVLLGPFLGMQFGP
jgi:hypothetical protein